MPRQKKENLYMTITFTTLLVWLIISALVGIIAELVAGRRGPGGILGAILLGFLAILLVVGVFHLQLFDGDPRVAGVPLITSILVAVLLAFLWSAFAYHRVRPYASRYYRRGTYARRPRRRWFR